MKRLLSIVIFIVIFFFVQPVTASDKNEADKTLKRAINSVVELLKDTNIDKKIRRAETMKLIRSVFDFTLIAKLTLGKRYWPKFSKEEKKEFMKLFIRQLENTYYGKIEFFSGENIKFGEPRQVRKKIYILTKIPQKEKEIEILYKMYNSHGVWKIYDAEIQGVSIVSIFRAQYSQFLGKGTVSEFLKKMREKNKALKD